MRKQKNLGPGENLEDLGELECQRSAPQPLLNSVLGENLEDLHHLPADPEELEFQRSAPNTLLNSVQHENLEDLHVHHPLHDPEELDLSTTREPDAGEPGPERIRRISHLE